MKITYGRKFGSFVYVAKLIGYLGYDNGMRPTDAMVPMHWLRRVFKANQQLSALTHEQLETLCIGEQTSMDAMGFSDNPALRFANSLAMELFDGELHELVFPLPGSTEEYMDDMIEMYGR